MTGVLIIAGIVVAAALGGLLLHALFHRFARSKPEAMTHTPDREGHVGRTSEFRESR
jgi:hypothetical protein